MSQPTGSLFEDSDPQAIDSRRVTLHVLSFLNDGDEVTVGRPDIGEFVILPVEGAEIIKRLDRGDTFAQVENWYTDTYGESVDVADFVADLDELGFVLHPGDSRVVQAALRWERLARAVFSPVAGALYVALLVAWVIFTVRSPTLLPQVHHLFFTPYISVLVLTLFLAQMPLILLHEAAHALAGRRLGIPSTLGIGRRLYFLVFETNLDGLVSVPRAKRYLPILAGMLTDLAVVAALTLAADAFRDSNGTYPVGAQFALALAYMTILRFSWQFWFFLRTDIYYLIVTVLGCANLQATSTQLLQNMIDSWRGKQARYDADTWHPVDAQAARWYSKLIVLGYTISIAIGLAGFLPAVVRIVRTVFGRLSGNGAQGVAGLFDSVLLLVLIVGEVLVAGILALRERRGSTSERTAAA